MTEDDIRWIAKAAVRFDCLVFILRGTLGSQPVLFPRSLYARATVHTV